MRPRCYRCGVRLAWLPLVYCLQCYREAVKR